MEEVSPPTGIDERDFDIERLQQSVAEAHRMIEELEQKAKEEEATLCYLYKWVERGMFDPAFDAKAVIEIMAHHPHAPWNRMRWDVDHKPYAKAFYKAFPRGWQA